MLNTRTQCGTYSPVCFGICMLPYTTIGTGTRKNQQPPTALASTSPPHYLPYPKFNIYGGQCKHFHRYFTLRSSKFLLKIRAACANIGIHERLVQLVERHVDIVEVVGSSPISLTINKKILRHKSGDFFISEQ